MKTKLKLEGTAFQKRVWRELLKVRRGTTVSYGELARRVGKPGAARAVGNAVKKNPYPVTIPCHRVIRSDGSIGGYAYGVKRKIQLLKREKSV